MADRRMISSSVVSSDSFLDLEFEAQALFFQLTMAADNFGFVSGVKRILRGVGVSDEALDSLLRGGYVLRFDSGVIVLTHWFVANWGGDFAKNDRTLTTAFLDELSRLDVDSTGSYVMKASGQPIHVVGNANTVQAKVRKYLRNVISGIDNTS